MQAGAWVEWVAGGVPYRLEVQLSWVAVINQLLPSLLLFYFAGTVKLSVILCLSDCPLSMSPRRFLSSACRFTVPVR